MTAPSATPGTAGRDPAAVSAGPAARRDPDLILARVHLLLGSLSLARTELETLAGRDALDDEAIRDLAEARWRTGDVLGAGEAATAWLEAHPDDVLGLVIAAEAQANLGRPGEARRLAGRAMERANGSLDPVFAGMQRSPIWPVEPGSSVGPAGVLFDDLHPGPVPVPPLSWPARPEVRWGGAGPFADDDPDGSPGSTGLAAEATGAGLWDDDAAASVAIGADALDPSSLFHQSREALEAGHTAQAGTGLILALRASPALAPAVLDLLAGRSEPILALVRGDAQRIVGREVEAMRDHAVAAGGLGDDGTGHATDDESGRAHPATADAEAGTDPTHPVQEDS